MKLLIACLLACGLISYLFASWVPSFLFGCAVIALLYTFFNMYIVLKKPLSSYHLRAASWLNRAINSVPWAVNLATHIGMVVGYALAGAFPAAVVMTIYFVSLTWFRKKAIAEYEKLHGLKA